MLSNNTIHGGTHYLTSSLDLCLRLRFCDYFPQFFIGIFELSSFPSRKSCPSLLRCAIYSGLVNGDVSICKSNVRTHYYVFGRRHLTFHGN